MPIRNAGRRRGWRAPRHRARHHLAGRKHRVAFIQRGDDEIVAVGCKQQRQAEQVRKLPINNPCWPWVGSTAVTKPSPICWAITEPAPAGPRALPARWRRARSRSRFHGSSAPAARQGLHVDMVGGAVQRQNDQRQQQRIASLMRTGILVSPKPATASPWRRCGEYQHEGGGERGQQ